MTCGILPLAFNEGSYIYGPSTIYSGHCPLYLEVSNATQRHHEDMKAVMEVGTKICQPFSHDLPSGKQTSYCWSFLCLNLCGMRSMNEPARVKADGSK